jgi:hypothetical protein
VNDLLIIYVIQNFEISKNVLQFLSTINNTKELHISWENQFINQIPKLDKFLKTSRNILLFAVVTVINLMKAICITGKVMHINNLTNSCKEKTSRTCGFKTLLGECNA